MDSPVSKRAAIQAFILVAVFWPGQMVFGQANRSLQPYLAQNKLYALQKPAGCKVGETAEANYFRVLVNSPDGASAVDFVWVRNDQGHSNAVRYLLAYRQFLSRTWPDVTFSDTRASRDNQKAVAIVAFHIGGKSIKGKYYFESNPRTLSAQGFFAPESSLPSQRVLLLNVFRLRACTHNELCA